MPEANALGELRAAHDVLLSEVLAAETARMHVGVRQDGEAKPPTGGGPEGGVCKRRAGIARQSSEPGGPRHRGSRADPGLVLQGGDAVAAVNDELP